jgi:hypothetical protein
VLFILALVVWIIFMLRKFPGNEFIKIEKASLANCSPPSSAHVN